VDFKVEILFYLLPGRKGRESNCELWTAEKFAFCLQRIAKIFISQISPMLFIV